MKHKGKTTSKLRLLDGLKIGPFTSDEGEKLKEAIDRYIAKNYGSDSQGVLKKLLAGRGRHPSIVTLIGRDVLPQRHSKSVYNYVRRHLLSHKTGKWNANEVLSLLTTYFNNKDICSTNSWKDLAKVINRSPEQIHDKWRELKPFINNYKSIVIDNELSEEEKLNAISSIVNTTANGKPITSADITPLNKSKISSTQLNSSTQDTPTRLDFAELSPIGNSAIKLDVETRNNLYKIVKDYVKENNIDAANIENIPWTKIQEEYPNYSSTKLRLHFNLSLLPTIYRRVYEGFNYHVIARVIISWIKKLLKTNKLTLHDINFKDKLPYIPAVFTMFSVKRELSNFIAIYNRGILDDTDKQLSPSVLNKNNNNYKHFKRVIRKAYRALNIKMYKKSDRNVLNLIKKNPLPDCVL